jgi:DNA-binding response OmpR family regulator
MEKEDKINTLIVDDEKEIRTLIGNFLSETNYNCILAEDGYSAL